MASGLSWPAGPDDLVLITADHGCDPGDQSTDHTREYVPLIAAGARIRPVNLGTCSTFADTAATIADYLGVPLETPGASFLGEILRSGTAKRP